MNATHMHEKVASVASTNHGMFRRISAGVLAQFAGLFVSLLDRLFVVALLMRVWGAEIYAEWAILLSLTGLLSMAEFGLNIYYGNYLQRAYTAGRYYDFNRIVSIALGTTLSLALGLVLVGSLLLLIADLSESLSLAAIASNEAVWIATLLGATAISRLARGAISQIYRGRHVFAKGVVVDLTAPATLAIVTIAAAMASSKPLTLAVLYLVVDLAAGWGVMILDQRRRFPDIVHRPSLPTRQELHTMVQDVRWLAIQQGAPIAWQHLPVVFMGWLGIPGTALVGFVLMRTLANLMRQLATMLSIAIGVEISTLHFSGKPDQVSRHLTEAGLLLSVIAAATAVAMAIFSTAFLAHWAGRPDLHNPVVMTALFGAALVTAPSAPLAIFSMLSGSPKPAAVAVSVQLIVGIAAATMLAKSHGVAGVACGLAVGEAIGLGVILPLLAAPQAGLDYGHHVGRCAVAMVITCIWCLLIGLGIATLIDIDTPVGLVVGGITWVLLGFSPAIAAALPSNRRKGLVRAAGSIGIRFPQSF